MKRCSTQLLKRSISPANSMILFSTCWFSGRKSLLCTEGQFQLSIMETITTLSSVQSLSRVQLFVIRWTAACQDSVSITKSRSLLKLKPIELVMHPSISSSVVPFSSHLQSFPVSGSFPGVSSLHQVAKVLDFQLQHHSFQ